MNLGELKVLIGADINPLIKKLKESERVLATTGKAFQKIGDGILKMAAPFAAFGAIGSKMAIDFDDSMRQVQAVMGGTTDDFGKLKDAAMEAGETTKFSASQSAQALKYMGLAGWDATKSIAALPGVLDLAAASGEDLALVSDIMTDSMTAFGLQADQATKFADLLAATASASNTNIAMLGDSFKYAAPLAGALGYQASDTSLALGLMANAGVKASQAGTSLSAIMSRIVKPTKESAKALKDLNIEAVNSDGTMKPLKDLIVELRAKFQELSPSQRGMYAGLLAGQEAMKGLLAITNAAPADFDKLSGAIDNSNGKASAMAKIMEGGLGGAIREIESLAETAAIEFGDKFGPAIEKAAKAVKEGLKWWNSLDDSVKSGIKNFTLWTVGIGVGVKSIGMLITAMAAYQQMKLTYLALLERADIQTKAFFATIKANPLGVLVTVLAIAGAALFAYTREWTKLNAETRIANQIALESEKAIVGEKLEIERLVAVIKDETASKEDKAKAVKKLKSINEEYFKDLDHEKIAVDKVTASTDAYIASLLRTAKIKAAEGALIKLEEQLLDVNARMEEAKPGTWQLIGSAILNIATPTNFAISASNKFAKNFKKDTDDILAQKKYLENELKSLSSSSIVTPSSGPSPSGGGRTGSVGGGGDDDSEKKKLAEQKAAWKAYTDTVGGAIAMINTFGNQTVDKFGEVRKAMVTDGIEPVTNMSAAIKNLHGMQVEYNSELTLQTGLFTMLPGHINRVGEAAKAMGEQMKLTREESLMQMNDSLRELAANGSLIEQVMAGVTLSLQDAAESGVTSMKELASAVVAAGLKIIRTFIIQGVTAAVAKTFETAPWPFSLVAAPLAGAAAGILFSTLASKVMPPKLARGGMTTGEVTATIGDNPSGKEAIIPFERMGEFLEMAGNKAGNVVVNLAGHFRLSGNDLMLVVQKAEANQLRSRGYNG